MTQDTEMRICAQCAHVEQDSRTSRPDCWKCHNPKGSDISPVTGKPKWRYCEDRNRYGKCPDFEPRTKPRPEDYFGPEHSAARKRARQNEERPSVPLDPPSAWTRFRSWWISLAP